MIFILISFVLSTYSKIIQISLNNYCYLIPRPTVFFINENHRYALYSNTFIQYSLLGQSMKSLMIQRNNKGEGTITLDDTYDIYKYQMDIKFEDDAILNNLSVYILRELS